MQGRQSHKIKNGASEIIDFKAHAGSAAISPAEKFESLKIINAEWISALNPSEFKLVCFIWQRTLYWGKRREVISLTHFLNGFRSRETGEILQAASGLGRRTVIQTLLDLQTRGVIFRSRNTYGVYSYGLNLAWEPVMLREPKTKKSTEKGLKEPKGGGANSAPRGCKKGTYKYENNKYAHTEDPESKLPDHEEDEDSVSLLNERIQSAKKKSTAIREKKLARAAKSLSVFALEKLWNNAVRKQHPEYPLAVWTKVQSGKVKKFKDQFAKESNDSVWVFMEFCIANWHRIGKLRFQWLKGIDYPAYPDVDFLMGFKKEFLHLFADDKFYERAISASPKEQAIRKFKKLGYTDEQAEQAYKESQEKSAAVSRYAKKADAAVKDVRALSAENKKLQREITKMRVREGQEMMEREKAARAVTPDKLNPGSKKKKRYDADGYLIPDFEVQDKF